MRKKTPSAEIIDLKLEVGQLRAENERLRAAHFDADDRRCYLQAALEQIALLDEADGHELTVKHAFQAVGIACAALGKHPSEIVARTFEQEARPTDG